jgi:phosphatidate cytidylyltransferase
MNEWVGCFSAISPVVQMGLVVLLLLVLATGTIAILKRTQPESDWQELTLRIRSWWLMAGFFFFSLLIHPTASLFLFAFLSFLALKEYFTLIPTRLVDHRTLFWAYLAIAIQYYWVYSHWIGMFLIFIPVYMFLFVPLRLLLSGEPKGMVESMAKIHWGLMAFVFCISHVAALMTLPATETLGSGGQALVLYLVFLTEMNDIAQYIWGKSFGKRKIAPTISPKKTWAGFIGGVITTVVLAVALQFLSGLSLPYSIAAGLLISLSGFVGDLVMSAVKRDVGVKDASHLIPGHGGMLDRIDSLSYSAPLFFHFISYFFYPAPR